MFPTGNDNSKVVRFSGYSRLDWSPEEILRLAAEAGCTEMIVIGRLPGGNLYFDSTQADAADVNWILDQIKFDLFGLKPAG